MNLSENSWYDNKQKRENIRQASILQSEIKFRKLCSQSMESSTCTVKLVDLGVRHSESYNTILTAQEI